MILEALDGFIIVFASNGQIYYASESITSLLGHLPVRVYCVAQTKHAEKFFRSQSDLLNMTIYDLAFEDDHTELYSLLSNPSAVVDPVKNYLSKGKLINPNALCASQ